MSLLSDIKVKNVRVLTTCSAERIPREDRYTKYRAFRDHIKEESELVHNLVAKQRETRQKYYDATGVSLEGFDMSAYRLGCLLCLGLSVDVIRAVSS